MVKSSQNEKTGVKKQPNKKSLASKAPLSETTALDSALREQIAQKAYDLYEKRGGAHGLDTEDWLEAERLVLAETKAAAKTDVVTKAKTPGRERIMATKSGSVLDRPRSA
jgi:hypothetical protein